jgi:hypothetical protein
VDETRPRLQGARLTAWELMRAGIPMHLIADNAAGHLMRTGKVDAVLFGADRVAANGDVANKIGTYKLAVVAARTTSRSTPSCRPAPSISTCPTATTFPSRNATPRGDPHRRRGDRTGRRAGLQPGLRRDAHRYLTGIVTEEGVCYPPFTASLRRQKRPPRRAWQRIDRGVGTMERDDADLADVRGFLADFLIESAKNPPNPRKSACLFTVVEGDSYESDCAVFVSIAGPAWAARIVYRQAAETLGPRAGQPRACAWSTVRAASG